MLPTDALQALFREKFQRRPQLEVTAPGRVNLLGEHTDYNQGFVLPVAIDRHTTLLAAPRKDRTVHLFSTCFPDTVVISLDALTRAGEEGGWEKYVQGVLHSFQDRRLSPGGMDLLVAGDLPVGAGLSSSASLEVAVAEACRALWNLDLPAVEMAKLCQRAETDFVGVQCGIMDQFVTTLAEPDAALFLDCRSLDHQSVPFRLDARIVVADSRVERSLQDSSYNTRRLECDQALYLLNSRIRGISSLRDLSREQLQQYGEILPADLYSRAWHVVTENERVLDGVEALKRGDGETFGKLMVASHESLRDHYRVSCAELDLLVDLALESSAVLGSRMTGAGFGGCTVTLVLQEGVESFSSRLQEKYREKTGREAGIYVCRPSAGVRSRFF